MKNILLPTDYSTNAQNGLAYALNLAKQFKGSVNILNVLDINSMDSVPFLKTSASEVTIDELPNSRLTSFVKKALDSKSLNAPEKNNLSFEVGSGFPGSEIRIRSNSYDLIVMGKKGKNSISEKLFGGVTTSVLTGANCPVLVVPEKAKYKPVNNILFAVNYHSITTESVRQIIDTAEQLKARLHFVHVKSEQETQESNDLITESLLEEILTMDRVPKIAFEVNIIDRNKSTNKTLETYIKDYNIDMVAMVKSHQSIFKTLFLESHTRDMCYTTEIPLLSLPGKQE